MKYLVCLIFTIWSGLLFANNECSKEVVLANKQIVEYKKNHNELLKLSKKIIWLPKEFKDNYKLSYLVITKDAKANISLLKKYRCSPPISREDVNFITYATKLDRVTYYHILEIDEDATLNNQQKLNIFNELQEDSINSLRLKYL